MYVDTINPDQMFISPLSTVLFSNTIYNKALTDLKFKNFVLFFFYVLIYKAHTLFAIHSASFGHISTL